MFGVGGSYNFETTDLLPCGMSAGVHGLRLWAGPGCHPAACSHAGMSASEFLGICGSRELSMLRVFVGPNVCRLEVDVAVTWLPAHMLACQCPGFSPID